MPRLRGGPLYLGIKGHVIAVDRATGAEQWRTKLGGVRMRAHDFVYLHHDGDALFAAYNGEVFCLDPKTGAVRWHNQLTGLGTGLIAMATDAPTPAAKSTVALLEEQQRRNTAAATAAAT